VSALPCSLPSSPSSSSLRHSPLRRSKREVARIGFLAQGPAPLAQLLRRSAKGARARLRRGQNIVSSTDGRRIARAASDLARNSSVSRWMSSWPRVRPRPCCQARHEDDPIVMAAAGDPVEWTCGDPSPSGGNVTGLSTFLRNSLETAAAPKRGPAGVSPSWRSLEFSQSSRGAPYERDGDRGSDVGLQVQSVEVRRPEDFENASRRNQRGAALSSY